MKFSINEVFTFTEEILTTFTEEILNGKLHFLCSVKHRNISITIFKALQNNVKKLWT